MSKILQITIRELLKDPLYKKWFSTVPKLPPDSAHTPPWRIYVQAEEGGSWARTETGGYVKAYRYVAKHIRDYHDICIQSKRHEFRPPVVKDKSTGKRHYWPCPVGHRWCPYCRRPTVFTYFSRHHLFSGRNGFSTGTSGYKRCVICGIRLVATKDYSTPLISQLRGWEFNGEEVM